VKVLSGGDVQSWWSSLNNVEGLPDDKKRTGLRVRAQIRDLIIGAYDESIKYKSIPLRELYAGLAFELRVQISNIIYDDVRMSDIRSVR